MLWCKFYFSDWRSDPRLRMCGLAARGLWMEMLALMHEAEPYGHLVVNGVPPTDAQLAILAGAQPDQVPACLAELETAGVFSRNRAGTIYSRRMTRDEKRRKDGEKSAKTGKIPGSRRSKQGAEKEQENTPPPPLVGGVDEQPPPALEARSRDVEKEEAKASKKKGTKLPEGFVVPDEWVEDGYAARAKAELPWIDLTADRFRFPTYWCPRTGSNATKTNWHQTWINWCLNAKGPSNNGYPQRKLSPAAGYYAGSALALADRAVARAERPADSGADLYPAEPLLDR